MAVNSLYIGSLYSEGVDKIAVLPERIRQHLPDVEPRPNEKWTYRVSEPFYTAEGCANVHQALKDGMISSASEWPQKLAANLRNYYDVPVVFPTSSGATALLVALLAADVGPGDQVIVPAMTMVAVCNAVKLAGATPIYADCAPGGLNPGCAEFAAKSSPRVKALITVNTFGVAYEMDEIVQLCKDKGWTLVEDICEAIGTRYKGKLVGTFGEFACGSLYANKIITAGDGGWVHSTCAARHDRLKSLINHGFDPLYHFVHFETAPNAKINGLGAALACASIAHIDSINAHRNRLAKWYRQALASAPLVCMPEGDHDQPWVFGAICESTRQKSDLRAFLAVQKGIETRNYFIPLHIIPVNYFQGTREYEIELPEAEKLGDRGLYFPSHRYLAASDVEYIGQCVAEFFGGPAAPPAPREPEWVDREGDLP